MFDKKRIDTTLEFLRNHLEPSSRILDLGGDSLMAEEMRKTYIVDNTGNYDLDFNPTKNTGKGYDAVTSFEVFEHLYNPFGVLLNLEAPKLICSVPLNLWFQKPWKGPKKWDWHFHEFYEWQFDELLNKTGWKIIDSKRIYDPKMTLGIRPLLRIKPLLRFFWPRFYLVCAIRVSEYEHT